MFLWDSHLPQEDPLAVVEQANDGGQDDGALGILWHVLEDGSQAQEGDAH